MISAKRIVSIFLTRGGSGEFTKTAQELDEDQLSTIQDALGDEAPLIASVRSRDEWFAITRSHLYRQAPTGMHRIPLQEIVRVDREGFLGGGKFRGGVLEMQLRDKSMFTVAVESGKPYTALLNLFLHFETVNRKTSRLPIGQRPTTDDKRPLP